MASTDLSIEIAPELTDEQSMIVLALARGATRSGACSAVGVERWRFYEWLEKCPVFSQSCLKAEGIAETGYTNVIARAALGGDWKAAAFWLRTRRRDQWRENVNIDLARRIRGVLGELDDGGTEDTATGSRTQEAAEERVEENSSNASRSEDSNS